ncbi:MAG TPA: glycosyl hydrolase family 28-related protein, partial [Longimicrobiaceae bacterium]|nr:glycosyl hydrolase family 28-related protein [Longimicrobiaceae bacterium]
MRPFQRMPFRLLVAALALAAAPAATLAQSPAGPSGRPVFDVRSYGARGDGKTLDTDAINRAITAASAAGGGTVYFPAGTYASF